MSGSVLHVLRRRVASSLMPVRGGGGAPYPGSDYKAAGSAVRLSVPACKDMHCISMYLHAGEDRDFFTVLFVHDVLFLQLPEALDMTWDDGTRNIEPVMDIYAAEHISLVRHPLEKTMN